MTATTTTTDIAPRRLSLGRWFAGGLAVFFGLMTLVEGSQVLFAGPAARAEAGNVVSFVLLFNFTAGFAYIAAGLGALTQRSWSVGLARVLAVTTLLVFAALAVHIAMDGAFEKRTVLAMTVRSVFWVAQAFALSRLVGVGKQ